MLELMKKVALAGVGAVSLTAEQAEALASELVLKGKITELEGRKFVAELRERAVESKATAEATVKEQVKKGVEETLKKMNLAQADEVLRLREEIEKLRAELQAVKK